MEATPKVEKKNYNSKFDARVLYKRIRCPNI
jgi:hypothetical protein